MIGLEDVLFVLLV